MNKYIKNYFLSVSNTLMMLIFPIITFPYVSRVLGPSPLGVIYFAQSYGYYFIHLANFGITSYAIREVSRVRDDPARVEITSNEIFNLNIFFSIISTALYFTGVLFVQNFRDNFLIFALYSVVILSDFLTLDWLLMSYDDYLFSTVRNLIVRLLALISVFAFVRDKDDYVIYMAIICVSEMGIKFSALIYCRKKYARLRFSNVFLNFKDHIKPMFTLFSYRLVGGISTNLDKIMIGFMLVYASVGVYSAGIKIAVMLQVAVETIGVVMFPRINISADSSKDDYLKCLKLNYNLILLMGIPMTVGLFLISGRLIPLFAGEEYYGSIAVSRIMVMVILLGPIGDMIGSKILLVHKKDNWLLYCSLISTAANVILNCIFIPLYGINGAAFASLIGYVVSFLTRYLFAVRLVKIRLITKGLLKYSLFTLPFVLIYCFLRVPISTDNVYMFSFVAVCATIYAAELIISKDSAAREVIDRLFKNKRLSNI
ncbi:MAG: flippase [Clostridiales bacterium]|nr:flippase [Clostridiales bacterium]